MPPTPACPTSPKVPPWLLRMPACFPTAIQNAGELESAFRNFPNCGSSAPLQFKDRSRQLGKIYHAKGVLRQARNVVLKATPPLRFIKQLSWIYDWKMEESDLSRDHFPLFKLSNRLFWAPAAACDAATATLVPPSSTAYTTLDHHALTDNTADFSDRDCKSVPLWIIHKVQFLPLYSMRLTCFRNRTQLSWLLCLRT